MLENVINLCSYKGKYKSGTQVQVACVDENGEYTRHLSRLLT